NHPGGSEDLSVVGDALTGLDEIHGTEGTGGARKQYARSWTILDTSGSLRRAEPSEERYRRSPPKASRQALPLGRSLQGATVGTTGTSSTRRGVPIGAAACPRATAAMSSSLG